MARNALHDDRDDETPLVGHNDRRRAAARRAARRRRVRQAPPPLRPDQRTSCRARSRKPLPNAQQAALVLASKTQVTCVSRSVTAILVALRRPPRFADRFRTETVTCAGDQTNYTPRPPLNQRIVLLLTGAASEGRIPSRDRKPNTQNALPRSEAFGTPAGHSHRGMRHAVLSDEETDHSRARPERERPWQNPQNPDRCSKRAARTRSARVPRLHHRLRFEHRLFSAPEAREARGQWQPAVRPIREIQR